MLLCIYPDFPSKICTCNMQLFSATTAACDNKIPSIHSSDLHGPPLHLHQQLRCCFSTLPHSSCEFQLLHRTYPHSNLLNIICHSGDIGITWATERHPGNHGIRPRQCQHLFHLIKQLTRSSSNKKLLFQPAIHLEQVFTWIWIKQGCLNIRH